MEIARASDYDRLLARHHAMRLRRQILAPGAPTTSRCCFSRSTSGGCSGTWSNLHRPDHMSAVLRQLGSDHRKLGVWAAHYDAFAEALCEALRMPEGGLVGAVRPCPGSGAGLESCAHEQ